MLVATGEARGKRTPHVFPLYCREGRVSNFVFITISVFVFILFS